MGIIKDTPASICDALASQGVKCNTVILELHLWHIALIAIIFFIAFGIAKYFLHFKRLDKHNFTHGITCPYGATNDKKSLRLNPYKLAELLGEKGYDALGYRAASTKLNEKYSKKYFIAHFTENGQTVLRTEVKLVGSWFKIEPHEIKADAVTLQKLKVGSISRIDDDTGNDFGADGLFDLFVRPVKWWDVRHWFFHPSREIRYALYVAVFAALLEYSGDVIELMRTIFQTPA